MPLVHSHHLAREWRCSWAPAPSPAPAPEAAEAPAPLAGAIAKLNEVLEELSLIENEEHVQRLVSEADGEMRVITTLQEKAFKKWEAAHFAPEAAFLEALRSVEGIEQVEARTFAFEEVKLSRREVRRLHEYKEREETQKAEEADPVKRKLRDVISEGGRRGAEIEGAAELGNLQYFCTSVDEPEGNLDLLEESVKAMNTKSEPDDFGRKGGSGHVGKMVFSAGEAQLAIEAYVPEEKQEELICEEWLQSVLAKHEGGKVVTSSKGVCVGCIPADPDKGVLPVNLKEALIVEANKYLKEKGLFPAEGAGEADDVPAQS